MKRLTAASAALLLGALPALADCLEDGQSTLLTGAAAEEAEGWIFTSDISHCLVIPAWGTRADGTAVHRTLPDDHRRFTLDWAGAAPVTGRVEIAGTVFWRGEIATLVDYDPPFGVSVMLARPE